MIARSTSRNQKKNLAAHRAPLGFDLHAQHGIARDVRLHAILGLLEAEAFRLAHDLDGLDDCALR